MDNERIEEYRVIQRRHAWRTWASGVISGLLLGFGGWCLGSLIGWKPLQGWDAAGVMALGCVLGLNAAYRRIRSMPASLRGWPGEGPGR